MKDIFLRLPEHLTSWLDALARKERRSRNSQIIYVLESWQAHQTARPADEPQSKG